MWPRTASSDRRRCRSISCSASSARVSRSSMTSTTHIGIEGTPSLRKTSQIRRRQSPALALAAATSLLTRTAVALDRGGAGRARRGALRVHRPRMTLRCPPRSLTPRAAKAIPDRPAANPTLPEARRGTGWRLRPACGAGRCRQKRNGARRCLLQKRYSRRRTRCLTWRVSRHPEGHPGRRASYGQPWCWESTEGFQANRGLVAQCTRSPASRPTSRRSSRGHVTVPVFWTG